MGKRGDGKRGDGKRVDRNVWTDGTFPKEIHWCPEGDLNPHVAFATADFKSAVSADSTIRARLLDAIATRAISLRVHTPFGIPSNGKML